MFVNRISELVKHTLQQMASLHSPQAYVLAATFHPMIYIHVHVLSHFSFTQDCKCDECKWNPLNGKWVNMHTCRCMHVYMYMMYMYVC